MPENPRRWHYTGWTPQDLHTPWTRHCGGRSAERYHSEGSGIPLVMAAKLYWVEGPWTGKLALSARPRGGDWLEDEVADWKRAGIGSVLSLLTPEEGRELDLRDEGREVKRAGLDFWSLPIEDRQVPRSEAELGTALDNVNLALSAGRNVLLHCRQGVGRTGLAAVCLLVKNGMSPGAAVDLVSAARGVAVPETAEQREWIERYAPAFSK
jgi:protein-tyrosine phosphatase